MIQKLKTFLLNLTSTRAAGMYLLLFAIAIGAATFVENDFGTSSAQAVIFKSWWFELLLVLFGATIAVNVWRFKMVKQKKWATICFHLSILIILAGAAVTRYFGTEGMMHIREGETSNRFLSAESFLKFKVLKDGKTYSFDEPTYFSSLGRNKFNNSYQIGNSLIEVNLDGFIPNPKEKAEEVANGAPMIKVVVAGAGGREEYFVKQGDKATINGVNFNFSPETIANAFNVMLVGDSLTFVTDQPVSQMVMATQTLDTLAGNAAHPLRLRSMYNLGGAGFVIGEFIKSGKVSVQSDSPKVKNESAMGLNLSVSVNGKNQKTMVTGYKGDEGEPQILDFGTEQIAISYGAQIVELPFSLKCRDFILEKYPGTENPSSYASEVTLIDPQNSINQEQRIFMNNILEHGGYRFFQSSFDQDELGTYLSVNHDFWGTWISYIGYVLLTIGLIMTFFAKNSRFSSLLGRLKEYEPQVKSFVIIGFLFFFQNNSFSQANSNISKEHAAEFGKLLVQDHNGRIKPANTFTSELLRKISRKDTYEGLTSDQVYLSMMNAPADWHSIPIIQVPKHPQIAGLLKSEETMLGYRSFFDEAGNYILEEKVREAQAMMPKDQGTFEKAVIKLDEKVNIVNMIFAGTLLKIFPLPADPSNTWLAPSEAGHSHGTATLPDEANSLYMSYLKAVNEGSKGGNFEAANTALGQIKLYQNANGTAVIPAEAKQKAELLLNKLDVFSRLRNYYGLLCLVFISGFLFLVGKKQKPRKMDKIRLLCHGFGLCFSYYWLRFALVREWVVHLGATVMNL